MKIILLCIVGLAIGAAVYIAEKEMGFHDDD